MYLTAYGNEAKNTVTKTNIIKINGKSYDAMTGKPLEHGSLRARPIDDVVAASPLQPQVVHPAPTGATHSVRKAVAASKVHRVHTAAPAAKVHKTHPSKTIMRHAVQKPTVRIHTELNLQTRTDIVAVQPELAVDPKLSVHGVDKRREARAKRINKSKLVSRFGSWSFSTPVTISRPQQKMADVAPVAQHPTKPTHHSTDIFEEALRQATSHEMPPVPAKGRAHATRKRRVRSHRLTNFGTAALAVVLVGGFLAYQNVANVTLHMASGKAGFAAALPAYRPSGFSIGRFAYSPGNVTIHFHSNSDTSRNFAIIEKPSNWNSETLLNDFVATKGASYQTVQTAGRTIYLYGDKKATWVDNGVWYDVDAASSLSTNQLVSLASSM